MQATSAFKHIAVKAPNNIVIDGESKFIFFIVLVAQLFFRNGFYLFVCSGTTLLLFYLLQKTYKPSVFTFIALHHILQIIAGVWLADYADKDIDFRSPMISVATIASLIGLIFLFLPIIFYQNKLPDLDLDVLKRHAYKISTDKTLKIYLIAFFVCNSLGAVAFAFGGITQIIFSFIKIKWLFFLLFGLQSILKNERRSIFYTIIALEFITGFYSYFSDFKTVIYFLIILLLVLLKTINLKGLIGAICIGMFLVFFALFWTSIKGEYRSFLNAGQQRQTVQVSQEDALNKLYKLSDNIDQEQLNSSAYNFLDRIQYTFHFARTIERVPGKLPFTNGKNWFDNFRFATTPRFLNPDKPILEATEKTKKYTGIAYAGFKKGASFSLGYFAESYIDFGFFGMMFFLLLLGYVYGIIYWYLMRKSSTNFIFNYAVVGAFFMEFYAFEMDGTFLLGRLFASLVTFVVMIKFVFPTIVQYITISATPGRPK